MAGLKNRKSKERVQIDADWLLGESVDKKANDQAWFRRSVVSLVCIVAAVWSWPYVSKQWLQWEWQKQLAQSTNSSSEDVLPILLALNDLNPNHNESVIQQLASTDPEKRLVAFHLLQKRIERWTNGTSPTVSELNLFSQALQAMPGQLPEALLLRGQLAARMLRLVGNDMPNSLKLRLAFEGMIASAATATPSQSSTETAGLASAPIVNGAKIDGAIDAPVAKIASNVVTKGRLSDSPQASDRPLTPDPPSIRRMQTDSMPLPSGPAAVMPSLTTVSTKDNSKTVRVEATISSVERPKISAVEPPVTTRMTPMVVSKPARMQLSDQEVDATPNKPMSPDPQVPVSVSGIEKKPFEQLLTLLSSSQPRMVQAASDEFIRRGMNTQQLEMAIRIAQGDVTERLSEMDRLVRDSSLDPIPWLTWLAENADRDVRRRAVSLLGTISAPDALRSLRMLKNREPDSAIVDQISQVLLASGSAANSLR
jgi:hypothetical protein